jgi:polyisoprenoid-binding protein YceI
MKFSALLAFIAIIVSSFTVIALKPIDGDDAVTFTIKNFGLNTKGSFKGLKGSINWDAATPANSAFNVSIDANSINTAIDSRDNHLRKEEYFDVEKYPTINFTSTAVTANNVTGNLTIKGVTKSISFPFTVATNATGYLFQGSFSINRRDFNVGGGSMVLADNVIVNLKVHANK